MAKCPVCKAECGKNTTCNTCGFNDVGRVFINREEAELWQNTILSPYIIQYEHKNDVLEQSFEGKRISFGSYQQGIDGTVSPISWYVIKDNGSRLLLLSEYCIDCRPFETSKYIDNGPTQWYNCSLRKWLNSDFIEAAFTIDEYSKILSYNREETIETRMKKSPYKMVEEKTTLQDKVFLLSNAEIKQWLKYGDERLKASPTEYAKYKNIFVRSSCSNWWLRDRGFMVYNINTEIHTTNTAQVVKYDGTIDKTGLPFGYEDGYFIKQNIGGQDVGVRPAMWIKK